MTHAQPAVPDSLPEGWAPRFYEPGDDTRVVALLQTAFERWPNVDTPASPLDHLRWKIGGPPHGARLCLVAEFDGRIVGWQGYWLLRIMTEGTVRLAKQTMDVCVHPEYRGLGSRLAMRGMALKNERRAFEMNLDVHSGQPAMRHIVNTRGRHNARPLANSPELLVTGASLTQPAKPAHPASDPHCSLVEVDAFDDRVDAFWEDASKPFVVIVERRRDYLNWRYADPRAGTFRITLAEEDGRLLGYIVTATWSSRGKIADLLPLPDRLDVVDALVGHAVARFRDAAVRSIECWSPAHHPYRSVLERHGLRHVRRTIRIGANPARELEASLPMPFRDDPEAPVHMMMGDTDLV